MSKRCDYIVSEKDEPVYCKMCGEQCKKVYYQSGAIVYSPCCSPHCYYEWEDKYWEDVEECKEEECDN